MNKEIIEKNESGACVTDIARELIKAVSTIGTIVKTKEKIKVLKMANGVTLIVFKKRPQIINQVKNLLLVWIEEKQLAGGNVNEKAICGKAKEVQSTDWSRLNLLGQNSIYVAKYRS